MSKRVACLCPTFARPICTANVAALFQQQTYDNRFLYILDDGGTFLEESDDDRIKIKTYDKRFNSLPEKYNFLLEWAIEDCSPDIIFVWENDDIYLPDHIWRCANALYKADVLRPNLVFVYDPLAKKVRIEPVYGNFHGSLVFRASLAKSGVHWPDTKAAAFDLQFLRELTSQYRVENLEGFPTYVFRFPCTETINGECFMSGPDDISWYDRYGINYGHACCPKEKIKLEPKVDKETRYFFDVFYKPGLIHQIAAYYKRYNKQLMP